MQLDIKIYPNKRAMLNLKSGDVDLLCAASFTEERSEFAYYSISYRSEELGIMVRKGTAQQWSIDKLIDIGNYPDILLAAGRGGWYGSQYQEILDDPEVSRQLYFTDDIGSRLSMLSLSRVDMVIGDINALIWNASQLDLIDSFEIHPLVISSEPIHFIFSKNSVSAELVSSVNNAIELLTENGTIGRMHNDYITNGM